MTEDAFEKALREELARRIAEFSTYDEKEFGTPLSSTEIILALVGFALLPIFVVWVYA